MEWRRQSSLSCADAFIEAQRWIQEVTGKSFDCSDFRAALENGVLLCDLINKLKPGIIKRVNRLSTPIAGLAVFSAATYKRNYQTSPKQEQRRINADLPEEANKLSERDGEGRRAGCGGEDNVNVFLKACGKLGLNESQLFHPGDLQDLSTRVTLRRDESQRRVKNVLVTVYWLGRKAQLDPFYGGPQLNFKAFEGLLGLALSKTLEDGGNVSVKDGGYKENRSSEEEFCQDRRQSSVGGNSEDCFESLDTRVLRPHDEACGSDAEAEQVFRMDNTRLSAQQNKAGIPPALGRKHGRGQNPGAAASPLPRVVDPQPSHLLVPPPESAVAQELRPCEEDSEDDQTEADPILDDLYFRRLQQTLHQTSSNPDFDRFLPRYWTPEEESRVRRIYLGSQKRPWYRKMLGLRTHEIQVRPEKLVQVNPGWIWSKSLSDIPMVYPARHVSNGNTIYNKGQDSSLVRAWSQESERKRGVSAKDGEAQWQDDLTKWKNRRRSTKTELYRKSQDINQMVDGAAMSHEAQGGPIKRFSRDPSPWQHSTASRFYSTASPSKPSSSERRPHTRALLTRSYATEDSFSSKTHPQGSAAGAMPASAGSIFEEEKPQFTSLASDRTKVTSPSLDHTFTSLSQVKAFSNHTFQSPSEPAQPQNRLTNNAPPVVEDSDPFLQTTSSLNPASSMPSREKPPVYTNVKEKYFRSDSVNEAGVKTTKRFQDPIHRAEEESQNLDNRTQQAAGNSKYPSRSVSWSSSASLPRGFRRSEGSSRIPAPLTARPFETKQSRMSSVPRLYSADDSQVLLLNCEKEDSSSASPKLSIRRQTAAANLRDQYQASVRRQKKASQARQVGSEQRQEVHGFSLQSTAQTQVLPPNMQSYHNKSSTLPSKAGTDYAKVDHSDMRVSLTLKPNSVPDFGFQTLWDSTGLRVKFIQPAGPAEHCQLRVDDEIVAVDGVAVAHLTSNQWKNKMASSLQSGSLTMDVRRYGIKDWSNSKENHPNQPPHSRMTLNLTSTAPVLMGYPDHHTNSVAPTDTQMSKSNWQKENATRDKSMDGVLSDGSGRVEAGSREHCSVTRQNQKRREDFFSEKGGSESAISDLQVPSLSPSTCSWSWDREEDRRRQEKWQEEQERLLQEQYQRDQERLEAEWRQAQQDAVEGRKLQNTSEGAGGPESVPSSPFYMNGLTKKTAADEQRPGEDLKEGRQSVAHRPLNDNITENDWAEGSSGFTRLSPAHRALSSSTPALSGPYKQTKGDQRRRLGRSLSKAERERQQILEEMKKRTQLLTDNSWIRQRSNSFHKESIDVGASMKRYESLDNLDTLSSNLAATFSFPRPHSVAGGYVAPSRNAASRYSTGSMSSQRNESPHYARMVSGTRTCCMCERVLGSGAAMVIEALSLYFHLTCFQCVGCCRHLGGTETGVQVHVRNRKPFCERCYFQLNSTGTM